MRVSDIDDPRLLRQAAELLEKENQRLVAKLVELTAELASLRGGNKQEQLQLELIRVQEELAAMQRRLFAASSERRPSGDKDPRPKPEAPSTRRVQKELPRVPIVHDLTTAECVCERCGNPLREWEGQTEDHSLVGVLAREFVIEEHHRKKYVCRCGAPPVTAPGPVLMPGGGRHSLDFAVEVAIAKYADHMPLERQTRAMKRDGLDVESSTLWDQIERLSRLCVGAYDGLREHLVRTELLHADETPWYLLDKGRRHWWVWSLSSNDAVYYAIDPSRGHKTLLRMLEGFDGVLVADGHSAYETARKARSSTLRLAGCWSHGRRGFVEAEPAYPECVEVLDLIAKLFEVEKDLPDWAVISDPKLRGAALEHIRSVRAARSAPIVEAIENWAKAQRALPRSKLGEAITYLRNQWEELTLFLRDPRVPLTNNHAERSLRGPVVGRKNHYGSKSQRGTEVAAIFYSLIESAKLARVDVREYLRAVAVASIEGREPVLPGDLRHPR